MAKIAILGFGTVGSGVLEVVRRNAASIARRVGEPVEVKYILDVRDFSTSPDAALFTDSIDTILNDPEVKVVVETIGGTRFALPYVRKCLASGRSVCTSNKEMVAGYGAELLAMRDQAMAVVIQRVRRDQMVNRGSSCSGLSHTMSILGLVASCCETNTRNAMMHPAVPSTANQRANTHRSMRRRHSIQAHNAPIATSTAMLTPVGAA